MLKRKSTNNEYQNRDNKRSKVTMYMVSEDTTSCFWNKHKCHNCIILNQRLAVLEKKIAEKDNQSEMWKYYIS